MHMGRIELFHEWGSIQSHKVRLCLAELDLPWISRRVDLAAFANLQADFLAINPLGLVPALRFGDEIVTESSRINERLNDLASGGLLPTAPDVRQRVRAWTSVADNVVHPAVRPPTFNLILKVRVQRLPAGALDAAMDRHPIAARADAYREAATAPIDCPAIIRSIATMKQVLTEMDGALSQRRWLAAETYTLADVAMSAFIDRLDRLAMSPLLDAVPNVHAWATKIRNRPSFPLAKGPETERPDPLVDCALVERLIAAANS